MKKMINLEKMLIEPIKFAFMFSKTDQEFIDYWVATAEDRVIRDRHGKPIELTTLASIQREFSTGADNRRIKEHEARRYICLHKLKHRGCFYSDSYGPGERVFGRKCKVCNVNIW